MTLLYIDDIVEALLRVGKQPSSSHRLLFNIGSSAPVPLLEFVSELETALGKRARKRYLPLQPGDVVSTYADVEELCRFTGYRPATSLREWRGENSQLGFWTIHVSRRLLSLNLRWLWQGKRVNSVILNSVPPVPADAAPLERKPWAKLARAMTTSAAGVAFSGVASIAATKILATTLGPSAVASLQTLQQARQAAVIAATSNGQTALVQGASSLEGLEGARYVRTVACIFLIGTSLASLGLWAAPAGVLRWLLDRTGLASMGTPVLPWLGIAVALTSAYVFLTALLNSMGKVGTLAALQVAGPGALAVLAYPAARSGGGRAIAIMVACSAGASAGAAVMAILGHPNSLRAWFLSRRGWWDAQAVRHFFSISTAMLMTGFLASAAVLAVRGNIVRSQGLQRTGLFDAAWSISMNQVTLVLASVQTYYLPALTRARTSADKTSEISRVLIAGTLAAAAVIASLALVQPLVLDLFYSQAFEAAHQYLRWTLVGDYLKVSSWILSVPMLAAADMKLFLASDLAASGTFLGAAFLLTRWFEPAESASMAFVLMYAVHLTVCLFYLRLRQGIRLDSRTIACWTAGLTIVLVATLVGWKGGW